jgi:hypothetical protein
MSQAAVEIDLTTRGYTVYRPVTAGGPVDLAVRRDGRWARVRVRTGRVDPRGRVALAVRGEADSIAVVVPSEAGYTGVDRVVYFPSLKEVLG